MENIIEVANDNSKKEESGLPIPLPSNPWMNKSAENVEDGKPAKFQGSNSKQYLAALGANLGAMAFGTIMSWTATALPDLRKDTTFGATVSLNQESLIASIVTLGAVVAGPLTGYSVEKVGRRRTMTLLTLPFVAGWLTIYFAQDVETILFGRFLTGICGGAFTLAAPIFTAEMASVNIRGTLAAGFDMMITVGMLYIFVVGAFIPWRAQALACGIIPLIFHLIMFFVPESPRWLNSKGRRDEAIRALMWFRGASFPSQVEAELNSLNEVPDDSCIIPTESSGTWRDLFDPPALKPILIVFALFCFQELSGIDPVLFFTVDIFTASGAQLSPFYSTIIVGVVQVVAATVAALLVDKSGRRFLLLLSEIFMVISLGSLGLFFYLKRVDVTFAMTYLTWLPLTSLIVYVVSYSIGLGPITYMIMGELLPSHVKGLASSILTSVKWLLGFVVTLFFEDLLLLLGDDGGFWLFAGFCLVALLFIAIFVPETKNKSLEEIQKIFAKRKPRREERQPLLSAPKTYGTLHENMRGGESASTSTSNSNSTSTSAELID